jgi:hypothetical protein
VDKTIVFLLVAIAVPMRNTALPAISVIGYPVITTRSAAPIRSVPLMWRKMVVPVTLLLVQQRGHTQ